MTLENGRTLSGDLRNLVNLGADRRGSVEYHKYSFYEWLKEAEFLEGKGKCPYCEMQKFEGECGRTYWRYTFAGMAMQGMLANMDLFAAPDVTTERAVEFADALMAELERKEPEE